MKKRILSIGIGSMILLAGCGGSSETASEVLEDFYMTANQGKYEEAEKSLSKEIIDSYEAWGFSLKEGMDDTTKDGTIESIKIIEETTENERGEVIFEITYEDGKSEEATVKMYKEDGDWKVGERE